MIEISYQVIAALLAVSLTFVGLAGGALWKLASKLGDIAGELKTIGVLMRKGEEQFEELGDTQKEHSRKIGNHETRITVLEG